MKRRKIKSFEDLKVWQEACVFIKRIYQITSKKPFSKDFSLKEQLRKSVISIPSNIAEGFERNSTREFKRFLKIAKGSAGEVRSYLYIAKLLDYVTEEEYHELLRYIVSLSKQIASLIKNLPTK